MACVAGFAPIVPATDHLPHPVNDRDAVCDGRGPARIGVGNFDRYPPEALTRPKVGGLIDPDVERIIALKPDLVVVYGTQDDLRTQLERAKIPMFFYQHAGLQDITTTIRELGPALGAQRKVEALADRIEAEIADVRKRVAGRPRPRTLLVFGRDAETLRGIYASGAVGFLARHARCGGRDERI